METESSKEAFFRLLKKTRYVGSAMSFHKDGSDAGSVTLLTAKLYPYGVHYLVYDEESGELLTTTARDCIDFFPYDARDHGAATTAKAPCGRRYKYSYVDADGETIYIGACL